MSPSSESNSGGRRGSANGLNYIEHQVSKMDTLAGVAIKYGVEVADVKQLNGLATDLQMFALKTLQIPLPSALSLFVRWCFVFSHNFVGDMYMKAAVANRHNTVQSATHKENIIEKTPPRVGYSNKLLSLESLGAKSSQKEVSSHTSTAQKISPAMISLQKFYGLRYPSDKGKGEGMAMAVYSTTSSDYFNDGLFPKTSPISDPFSSCNHKFLLEYDRIGDYVPLAEAREGEGEKSNENSVRRRQKTEAECKGGLSERLLKEENSGGSSDFSAATGKGILAMGPKSARRSTLATNSESGWLNSIPIGLGESIITDGPVGVRKSSSTPSFLDQDSSSSIWPTSKPSLKPDLQALSTVAIARPIFNGLPKPITGRWSKAA